MVLRRLCSVLIAWCGWGKALLWGSVLVLCGCMGPCWGPVGMGQHHGGTAAVQQAGSAWARCRPWLALSHPAVRLAALLLSPHRAAALHSPPPPAPRPPIEAAAPSPSGVTTAHICTSTPPLAPSTLLPARPRQVLQDNPLLIKQAQATDVPFEPVYQAEDGSWMVPSFNYSEKKADWQAYLDKVVSKPRWGDE